MSITVTNLSEKTADVGEQQVDANQKPPEELILRLKKSAEGATAMRPPDSPPHITWAADVIDNEHLGRLKSNCCCIYTKPRQWDDPSTWEQDEYETEHCRGHTELKMPDQRKDGDGSGCGGTSCSC
ncbi:hypothetical protein WR25_24821 [Diploscapter pachys]|uniref:E3 ubiquitin-protein ligase PPP1R11 n=1 Tax=Diploscapter pachys TaxID=2018661 RepID=A0A2A2KJY8_9BILA|nr:hypothetical protein WR25_24821 [Diploscapter pachys]